MTPPKRQIAAEDILPPAAYRPVRAEERRRISALKQHRRVEVGPFATFHFENFATIRHQIQEMLHIEGGGEAQLARELAAYGALVPRGGELVATAMFEIDEPLRRKAALLRIGGIEHSAFLTVGGEDVRAVPDPEWSSTAAADGRAAAVQFFHFPLTARQEAAFKALGTQVLLGFDHPHYGHIAVMPDVVRAALAEDL